jgi:hypothetical protein
MYWVNFLHIYQPSDQTKDIVERVVNESYRPLFKGFLSIPNLKINININGALTEILAQRKYSDVLLNIRKLAQDNKLEFTESAKYHSLLPFLEEKEALRQIEKNHQTNKKYFGKVYRPSCFFPPEMAYSAKIIETIKKTSCDSILLDEISYNGGKSLPPSDELLRIKNGPLVIFRERRVSNSIMSAMIRTQKEFLAVLGDDIKKNKYLCTAMDGETFGHHRPGLEKALFKIVSNKNPEQAFFSQLPSLFPLGEKISPVSSTWASTVEDIKLGIQFYSWKNPRNKVHVLQWKFLNHLIFTAKKKKLAPSLEEIFDQALASDQFFWASGEPWWSIEMIEKGAWNTLQALKALPLISKSEIKKGEDYYKEILAASFWWQRSGKIEQMAKKYKENTRIPFKERTLENNKPEVYYAFIDKMKIQMKKESKKENFERAILWRDAVWKMETKNDIYDAIHAVDLLRTEISDVELSQLMDKYKKKYENLRPGQPEKRKA